MSRLVRLIGIGVGDPDQVTLQAVGALAATELIFTIDKGSAKADLNALRRKIVDRFCSGDVAWVEIDEPGRDRTPADYAAEVRRWHADRAEVWASAIEQHLPDGGRGAFLIWGDPALYDSSLRILGDLVEQGRLDLELEMVPGISSVQLLAARHRIPLNEIGAPIMITTGRRLLSDATGQDTVVVMLDGGSAFDQLPGADWTIYWGAFLGGPDEVLRSGRLADVGAEIAATKRRAREEHGWIMDTYLLRRVVLSD